MSTDLYEVAVEFIGPPSERLEELPWLTKGVRRLATLAELDDARKRPVEDLLQELSERIAAARPGSAARIIPADRSVDKSAGEIIKAALLHRHHPTQHPPKQHLGVFSVKVLDPGQAIPGKYQDRVFFSRFLWLADPEHPLREVVSAERIFSDRWTVPFKHGLEVGFTSRSKSGAPLYAVAPPEWLQGLSPSTSYRTTAWF